MGTAAGVAILTGLIVTVAVGAFANPSLGDLTRPSWQPRDAAFSVWGAIYLAIALGGLLQLLAPSEARPSSRWAAGALTASLVFSAGWLLAVRHSAPLSALLIVCAFVAAVASLALQPARREPCNVVDRLVASGPALLSGWLSLAAPLGVNLAVQQTGGAELPKWAALPSAVAAASVGVATGAPEVGAIFVWAGAFSPPSGLATELTLLGVATAAAAVGRLLASQR